jgi:hypothetical protein
MKRLMLLLIPVFLMLISIAATAQQGGQEARMADLMRSEGRIYVVVAVILVILFGLILYLVRLDRKISKMEQQNN